MNRFVVLCISVSIAQALSVDFYASTPENQNSTVKITTDDADKHLKPGLDTKFFIHGWHSGPNKTFYTALKNAFFAHGKYNIIEVDYAQAASGPYVLAVASTPKVASKITDLIITLVKDGFPLKSFELIGHSLGGQLAGKIGDNIFKNLSHKILRITALDPAGPLFEPTILFFRLTHHLNKNDAEVVLAIHTNLALLGTFEKVGTADVYVNGGVYQPGCLRQIRFASCSHRRSHEYFVDAVLNPGSLVAAKCESYSQLQLGMCNNTKKIDLGGKITVEDEGKYYCTTTSKAPFMTILPPK